jgi:hypothetical protein
MAKTRQWQVRAEGPAGQVLTFGVQAASLPAAVGKALPQVARLPWTPDRTTVARLYGRHHPLRALSRTAGPGRAHELG